MPPGLNISSVCRSPPPRCSSDAPPPLRLGRFFLPWHLLRARSLARSLAPALLSGARARSARDGINCTCRYGPKRGWYDAGIGVGPSCVSGSVMSASPSSPIPSPATSRMSGSSGPSTPPGADPPGCGSLRAGTH